MAHIPLMELLETVKEQGEVKIGQCYPPPQKQPGQLHLWQLSPNPIFCFVLFKSMAPLSLFPRDCIQRLDHFAVSCELALFSSLPYFSLPSSLGAFFFGPPSLGRNLVLVIPQTVHFHLEYLPPTLCLTTLSVPGLLGVLHLSFTW